MDAAVFALYFLLVALTFSGAPGRFDARRHLIADEANAIGTAYLRLDLLAADSQPAVRDLFRRYVDVRVSVFRSPDIETARARIAEAEGIQRDMWGQVVAATRLPNLHPDAAKLLLPALNEMFDITTTRTMAALTHPPVIVFVLLFFLALVCSLLAGYGMASSKRRSWMHILAFAAAAVFSVFVVLEIEYPRQGLIRLDAYDQFLIDEREKMR